VTASPADVVRDCDFHLGEPFVRVFSIPRSGVLRLDDRAFVSETRIGETVLRHYAFASEWFKINVALDSEGTLIETPAGPDHPAFTFNCDIATPMRCKSNTVFSIDLFVDVLVRQDGRTYHLKDDDELESAVRTGLVSPHQFASARAGSTRLVGLIKAGGLIPFLHGTFPFGSSTAPEALPVEHHPVAGVPWLQPGSGQS